VLILDEPVSALDVAVRNRILNLLLDHHDRHGTAMLLISHDLALLHAVAHRVAVMDQGQVVESLLPGDAPTHPATARLLAATPTLR
jgi:peptide/nickel transport system ATP-binding protein